MSRAWLLLSLLLPASAYAQPGQAEPVSPAAQPPIVAEPVGHVRQGATAEISVGIGMFAVGGETDLVHGVGGINLGVGRFVSPTVAVSLRMSGVTILDEAFVYLGVIGPHVQAWVAPQFWIGGGLGIGFAMACAPPECETENGIGFGARLGYAFSPDGYGANTSIEVTSLDLGGANITSLALLIGLQNF